ncbi:hypothetical protein BYT27DRAFT_7264559 [Phlegmacium glaucopus]|nr:hypothetical protein BYT27DRAFT_7264559 [Phlegmacium glaucopus]
MGTPLTTSGVWHWRNGEVRLWNMLHIWGYHASQHPHRRESASLCVGGLRKEVFTDIFPDNEAELMVERAQAYHLPVVPEDPTSAVDARGSISLPPTPPDTKPSPPRLTLPTSPPPPPPPTLFLTVLPPNNFIPPQTVSPSLQRHLSQINLRPPIPTLKTSKV